MENLSLKPCPFCGCEAELVYTSVCWVRCIDCGAEAPNGDDGTKEQAAAIWNQRVPATE